MADLSALSAAVLAPAAPLSAATAASPAERRAANGTPAGVPDSAARTASPSVRASAPASGANLLQAQAAQDEAPGDLTDEEQKIVAELRKRDAEVRRHEMAHRTAGGPYTGAPTYTYTRGPDGRLYAVGGEVAIDVSPEGSPEATIAKMDIVIRAALAPAQPSAQDRAVANQAKQTKLEAQAELREERRQEAAEAAARRREQQDSGATAGTAASPAAPDPTAATAARAYNDAAQRLSGLARASADAAFTALA